MKNKRVLSEQKRESCNSNQAKQTAGKQQNQKQKVHNQDILNDNLSHQMKQQNCQASEYKHDQNQNTNCRMKQQNLKKDQQLNISSLQNKKDNVLHETNANKVQFEAKHKENTNENKEEKSIHNQVMDDQQKQQNQNQQQKQKNQIRYIQLQKMHNNKLKAEQQKSNQSQNQSNSQNQKIQQQQSVQSDQQQSIKQKQQTTNIQSQTSSNPQQQKQQQTDKLNVQNNHFRSPPSSPHSKIAQNINNQTRKTSSLVSKEKPSFLKNVKSQNTSKVESSNQIQQMPSKNANDNQKKAKDDDSESNYSFKPKNDKMSVRKNLEFSRPTSVTYYIESPHPQRFIGKVIAFINDTRVFIKNGHILKKQDEDVEVQKELIGRPPIPSFLDDSVVVEDHDEEEECSYSDQNTTNDLMNNYWPKKCESKRAFEEENSFLESMRVASIRNFEDILPNFSTTKEEMPPPIPQQLTDMEKKYMIAPPSPLSPFHAFNPRKRNRHPNSKAINFSTIVTEADQEEQIKRNITPKRSPHFKDSNSQPEIDIFASYEYDENSNENEEELENEYDYYYDYSSERDSENESESESENEQELDISDKVDKNKINKELDNKDNSTNNQIQNETDAETKTLAQDKNDKIDKEFDILNNSENNRIQSELETETKTLIQDKNDIINEVETDKEKDEKNDKLKSPENNFMSTNKQFLPELKNYERLISKMDCSDVYGMVQFIENELKGFNNMTSIKGPFYEEEMTVVRFKNMKCEVIELIHPKAFEEFRFGNCVYYNDDVPPDELHINAWHSLGIDPDQVSVSLDNFIKFNILGKNDISNIYGVLRYILKWIQLYPDDFFINPDCAVHTCKVLNRIIDKRTEVSSRSNILKALIKAISQRKKPYTVVQKPLPSVKYKESHKYQRLSIYEKIFKFEKNMDFLVQHFSYIDLCLIHKILRSEIIQLNFLKEDKKISAPHINDITTRFNIIARFVSYSILSVVRNHSSKLEKKCRSRIEFWISVMKKAREIRNFNLLYEIDAGLSHPSITRLTNVWKAISKSFRDDFNKLHDITKPVSEKMKQYVNLVLEDPGKTVPYLGTFFSRMVYSCELYHKKEKMTIPQNKLNDDSKIENQFEEITGYNMVYQYYLYKESSKIFLNWGVDYKFKLDRNFLQVCRDISFTCDNKRLSEFSIQIQPKK